MGVKKGFIPPAYPSWVIQSILYSPKTCRLALKFTKPLTQLSTASSPEKKVTGCETDNSTAPIAEVKEDLCCNSNPPVDLLGMEWDKLTILIASEN
jgi:hypothetical protein